MSYRASHQAEGYADFYDQTIFQGYAGDLWKSVERPLLEDLLTEICVRDAPVIDFACGTGRVTEVLTQRFPQVVGVDVSGEMLGRARQRCPTTNFIQHDLTASLPPELRGAGLVTAFRFFQNAEKELRDEVLSALKTLLRPGGSLILNVQCNAEGPAGVIQRLRGRLPENEHLRVMALDDVGSMLRSHGFAIDRVEWYGFWPRTGRYFPHLAEAMQRPMAELVRRLHLPKNRTAQMFMVRARLVAE